jgi:hypothetical protein
MRRLQLVELHEQPWFPRVWRDLLTDFLSFYTAAFRPYAGVAQVLANVLERSGSHSIVDLCSGAGTPVLSLIDALDRSSLSLQRITLSDKYPNVSALRSAARSLPGRVVGLESPIDARSVPPDIEGFRTVFGSFHHFDPQTARQVLADAVQCRQAIGVFEFTERSLLLWGLPILSSPILVWLATPFIKPLTWRRLLWTYLVPVVPALAVWDGMVSVLRTYTIEELEELARGIDAPDYVWETGRVRSLGASRVTYLVGWPLESNAKREVELS